MFKSVPSDAFCYYKGLCNTPTMALLKMDAASLCPQPYKTVAGRWSSTAFLDLCFCALKHDVTL